MWCSSELGRSENTIRSHDFCCGVGWNLGYNSLFWRPQPHYAHDTAAAGPTTTELQQRRVSTTHPTAVPSAQGLSCLASCVVASSVVMEKVLQAQRVCCAVEHKKNAAFERSLYTNHLTTIQKLPGSPLLRNGIVVLISPLYQAGRGLSCRVCRAL